LHRRGWRAHRVEQLGTRQEDNTGAGDRQRPAAPAGIDFKIVAAALDRSQCDCVDDQPRFPTRLDREQAADLVKHTHLDSLSTERANGGIAPFVH